MAYTMCLIQYTQGTSHDIYIVYIIASTYHNTWYVHDTARDQLIKYMTVYTQYTH